MKYLVFFILVILSSSSAAQINYLQYWTTAAPRASEGDVVIINDSTYISCYSLFYGGTDDDDGSTIYAKKTIDSGRTWFDMGVIQENSGLQTTNSPSLIKLSSGDLLLFYLIGNSPTDLKLWFKKSTDNGETWGASDLITDSVGYWISNNARAVVASSGRILIPLAYTPDINQSFGTSPAIPIKSRVWYSDDNGSTWNKSNGWLTAPQRGAMEPGLVETSAGNWLMTIRTQMGYQYFSRSFDNGLNWTAAVVSTLESPESPTTLIKTGGIILAFHNKNFDPIHPSFGKRVPLTVSKSTDNGNTWTVVRNIEDRPTHEFAYTSAIIVDGFLVLTYYDNISGEGFISQKFRKIRLSELGL